MSELALAMAAVASASVVLAADSRLATSVLAFSGDVTVLHPPGSRTAPELLVGQLLGLRGHGMTDVAGALRAAARQLAASAGGSTAGERCVVLLSDCLSTAGGDPATALAGIDRVDVLCPLPAGTEPQPGSIDAAARIASLGGGISQPIRTLAGIPAALTALLAGN